ncbi:MAG: hypothetical protein JSR73_09415 [Proteobacteria bacterium]|nr:hypothetical protein [Pseudomonadota bacterium]
MSATANLDVVAVTAPVTATDLIAYQRTHRGGPPPEGSILDPATLADNLTAVLEQHVERVKERWPKQSRRWDLDLGRWVPDGPPPPPFDLREDSTARALATLIGYVNENLC